jgi:RNA polymerase sigma factor (sigma-70 family)
VTGARPLQELMSDGVVSMMRAIDKFDEGRGFKFSTYATVALTRSFIRDKGIDLRDRSRYRSGCHEAIETALSHSADDRVEAECSALNDAVRNVLSQLDARDRSVISLRFGLTNQQKARTLDEVGKQLGISKERTRQLEVRAMQRVKTLATAARLEDCLD